MTGITAEPARSGSVVLPDARRLHYAEWGDARGTPVVLLSGTPGSSRLCPDVESTLAAGVRLIGRIGRDTGIPDRHRGLTVLSAADDLATCIRGTTSRPVAVVGWSGGGPYALALAARHPRLVRSIAVIASWGPLEDVPGVLEHPRSGGTVTCWWPSVGIAPGTRPRSAPAAPGTPKARIAPR